LARSNWPLNDTDPVTAGLDPTQSSSKSPPRPRRSSVAPPPAPSAAGAVDQDAIVQAAQDTVRAMMLIRTYRVRGHLAADLDPLGLHERELPEDLTPEFHGLDPKSSRPIFLGGALGFETATVAEIVEILRANYCGHVGLEYMHINDLAERRFLQERMEGKGARITFTPEGKQAILAKVIQAEQWEKFLARKFVGTKRFGLDGGESMVPALEAVIKYGGALGVHLIVIGMAHRGRLNVLSNVMAKPYRAIFSEFAGGSANPEDVGGSGDVKYHLGTSSDREFDGNKVHLSLVPNPSHLEAVNPVVLGKVRAEQVARGDKEASEVLPVLLHGDAAFAGQGIVAECFGFSGLPGYGTGGTIHFVINNQVGFTTSPQFARSSPYPSDIAKSVQAPILHVNGDDPEAVTFACKVAIDYRQTFKRDIVIDMWCYRRFGHNEGDEPSFTQPLMYARIRQHPPISQIYSRRLADEGVIPPDWAERWANGFVATLEEEFESAKAYLPNKADWFEGRWSGLGKPDEPVTDRRNVVTGIEPETLAELGRVLTGVPEGFEIHKTLQRILDAKAQMFASGEGFDWATAEAIAFGSLVREGYQVRLSGQDSGRGTFSHRHAVWRNQRPATATCRSPRPAAMAPAASKFATARSPNSGCSASNMAIRSPTRAPWCCGRRSSATSPTAPGHHRPVHRGGRTEVAARQRPRDAAPARLRGAGAGAQLRAARTLSAAVRRGQYAGRLLHHAGQLFPHLAPSDAARFPQAADHDDAQVAAAAQAGRQHGRRLHR
jgi:2-oxoglutarate dehydrogenase E1 component